MKSFWCVWLCVCDQDMIQTRSYKDWDQTQTGDIKKWNNTNRTNDQELFYIQACFYINGTATLPFSKVSFNHFYVIFCCFFNYLEPFKKKKQLCFTKLKNKWTKGQGVTQGVTLGVTQGATNTETRQQLDSSRAHWNLLRWFSDFTNFTTIQTLVCEKPLLVLGLWTLGHFVPTKSQWFYKLKAHRFQSTPRWSSCLRFDSCCCCHCCRLSSLIVARLLSALVDSTASLLVVFVYVKMSQRWFCSLADDEDTVQYVTLKYLW